MIKYISIILYCFTTTGIYAQKTFDYNLYLNGTIGFGIPVSNTEGTFNQLELKYSGSFLDKGSAYINLAGNFGLHLNVLGIGYWYDITEESILAGNPDYYLWDEINNYGNVKLSLMAGVAYKLNYNRLAVIPFFDLGWVGDANSSIDSYLLKEQNSNNIRQVSNSAGLHYIKFDYAFGADLYFHFGRHVGFATTIQYDRFVAGNDFTTTTKDYFSADHSLTDKMDFNHKNILISFGMFISFFGNVRDDKQ